MYVVAGARPGALLGDSDAEALGITSTNQEGSPPKEGQEGKNHEDVNNTSIPAMLRSPDKVVSTERPPYRKVKTKGKEETTRIVSGYKRPVLTEIKTKKWQDDEASVRTKAETNIGDSKAVTNLGDSHQDGQRPTT